MIATAGVGRADVTLPGVRRSHPAASPNKYGRAAFSQVSGLI